MIWNLSVRPMRKMIPCLDMCSKYAISKRPFIDILVKAFIAFAEWFSLADISNWIVYLWVLFICETDFT